jgi:signal transduction histidine kinase
MTISKPFACARSHADKYFSDYLADQRLFRSRCRSIKGARDITERMRIEDNRKKAELAAHLLHVQDTERRRIARDLHDGVGNLLSLASV